MSRSHLSRSVLAGLAVAGLVASLGGSPAAGATPPLGRVFMVNPVQSSGDQSLTDHKDSATAVPQSQYVDVPLTNLDGSGYLRGDWASVVSTTGKPVSSKTGYLFDRSADQFEQVMAYYWVTQAQLYIQSLGFGSELRPVNERQQLVRINQFGGDNSFYRPGTSKLTITLGKGGVDDAEDAEVVVHEYGHSVQDNQVLGFCSSLQAGSIGEAFGDYLAVEVGLWAAGKKGWPVETSPASRWPASRPPVYRLRASPTGTRRRTPRRSRTACAASTATRRLLTSWARCTPTARSGRPRCGTSEALSGRPSPTGSLSTLSSGSPPTPASPLRRRPRSTRPDRCTAPLPRPP